MDPRLFNILFLDIETASQEKTYDTVSERLKTHWERKASFLKNEKDLSPAEIYVDRAAIYAEFGKVICVGVGSFFPTKEKQLGFRVKTLAFENEKETLLALADLMHNHRGGAELQLCAHNGKEFDFPYLSRRMLIHGITLPEALSLSGKKPWEVSHLDTLEFWKFGDYKNFTSLDLLATVFDIPSSKSDISGADVSRLYHQGGQLDRIAAYCLRDVVVLARLFLRLKNLPELQDKNIFGN